MALSSTVAKQQQHQAARNNQRSKSYKFSEIHQNLELNQQMQSKIDYQTRLPAQEHSSELLQGHQEAQKAPAALGDPQPEKHAAVTNFRNPGSPRHMPLQKNAKPDLYKVPGKGQQQNKKAAHHSQQPSMAKSNFNQLWDHINFQSNQMMAGGTQNNTIKVEPASSADASSQANVPTSGSKTVNNINSEVNNQSGNTIITKKRTNLHIKNGSYGHIRQQTINIQNPQFIVQIQNCNPMDQNQIIQGSAQIINGFQKDPASGNGGEAQRDDEGKNTGPSVLTQSQINKMAENCGRNTDQISNPKKSSRIQEVKIQRPESGVEKKKKVVQFELSSASFSRSQPTDTEPSQSYTESVSDLNNPRFKKTSAGRENDQSAENEGSIEEIDDQFQSFRISPSRHQSSEVTITDEQAQSQQHLKALQQDLTPQKIESGFGNIGSIRNSDGINSRQVQSTSVLERTANQRDQDEVAPQTGPTTSHQDLQRVESSQNNGGMAQNNQQNSEAKLPAAQPEAQNNIMAAMASIMKQEDDDRIAREQQSKNFELSAAEEKYLELKILEILERNKKKQNNSKTVSQTNEANSADSEAVKPVELAQSERPTTEKNSSQENVYSVQMVPRKSQANQQIGQIIGGQKQRSRMKDNLYRVENYTVEEKNINNMAVTNGSQQSNQPYYQGMKKPPIYCMTMTQTLLGKPQKVKKIGDISSHITGSKSSQHSRKETSCNIDISSIQHSVSPPQVGLDRKGQAIQKLKVNKLKSANNYSLSSEFVNMQLVADKLQKGINTSDQFMPCLSQVNNQSQDRGVQIANNLNRHSPTGVPMDLLVEKQILSSQNVQAHSQEDIQNSAARKLSANFITRDAKNVFDKKKQRFEKIKRMRGQSEEGQPNSIEHSMQLINENYKFKGPSSTSLGGQTAGNVRTSMNQIELDKLLQLSDVNNTGSLDSQDTPKLGVERKNVNKTKFMRISENQSEETSQEFLSKKKNSGQNSHSKKKLKAPAFCISKQTFSLKDQIDIKSDDNSIYGNPDIPSSSSVHRPKNEVKSPKILQNQPRKGKGSKNKGLDQNRSPQRVIPLNTTKNEDTKKKLLTNQIKFLRNSHNQQKDQADDNNSSSTINNNNQTLPNQNYFLAPQKANPKATLPKGQNKQQAMQDKIRAASKSIGSQGRDSTSNYSVNDKNVRQQVMKTTKTNQIKLSIPSSKVAQNQRSDSRSKASPQTIRLKLVKKNVDQAKGNKTEKNEQEELSKDSIRSRAFTIQAQGDQININVGSSKNLKSKATMMLQNQNSKASKFQNDFYSCNTTKFDGNPKMFNNFMQVVKDEDDNSTQRQTKCGATNSNQGKYQNSNKQMKRKTKAPQKNQSVDNSQMQRGQMKELSNNKPPNAGKEPAIAGQSQPSNNKQAQTKNAAKTSVQTKAPTPAPLNAISSIAAESMMSSQSNNLNAVKQSQKKKLKMLSVQFNEKDLADAQATQSYLKYINMIKGAVNNPMNQNNVVQELSSCEEDNTSKSGNPTSKKSNIKMIGKQYLANSAHLKKAQMNNKKPQGNSQQRDAGDSQSKSKNFSQAYYLQSQNQSLGKVAPLDKHKKNDLNLVNQQKRRQKSFNTNLQSEYNKIKQKSQKSAKESNNSSGGVWNTRRGSNFVDNQQEQEMGPNANFKKLNEEPLVGLALQKQESKGSMQSSRSNMIAAGLIYYRNADTSIMNKQISKNSANTHGQPDDLSNRIMSKSKVNAMAYQSAQQTEHQESSIQQVQYSGQANYDSKRPNEKGRNAQNSAEYQEPGTRPANLQSKAAQNLSPLFASVARDPNIVSKKRLDSNSLGGSSRTDFYYQAQQQSAGQREYYKSEGLDSNKADSVQNVLQRVPKSGIGKNNKNEAYNMNNNVHNNPTCKDNFFNLLEISKQAESLPHKKQSYQYQPGAKVLRTTATMGKASVAAQPNFRRIQVNNSKESINQHSADGNNQQSIANAAYHSQPLNKKKIKFIRKPERSQVETNKTVGTNLYDNKNKINFYNQYNMMADQLNSHTNSISSDNRGDCDSFYGSNSILAPDNSANTFHLAKADQMAQFIPAVYSSSNYNSANVQTNADVLADQQQLLMAAKKKQKNKRSGAFVGKSMILPQKAMMDFNRYSIESLHDAASQKQYGSKSIQNSKIKCEQAGPDEASDIPSSKTKAKKIANVQAPLYIENFKEKIDKYNFFLQNVNNKMTDRHASNSNNMLINNPQQIHLVNNYLKQPLTSAEHAREPRDRGLQQHSAKQASRFK